MELRIGKNDYTIRLSTTGAELLSYKDPEGREYIWTGSPEYWERHSPVLFPSIGNVRNGKTTIRGNVFRMPKHGFARDMEFNIVEQTADHVCFLLTDHPETLKVFPYRFALTLTYQIFGSRLVVTYSVTNRDNEDMPYHIGAHPGFMCPFEGEEDYGLSDYEIVFEKKESLMATVYNVTKECFMSRGNKLYSRLNSGFRLKPILFNDDAIYFPNIKSRKITLRSMVSDREVSVSYPDFSGIAIWTPYGGEAPFVCLEPWNGSAIYDDEPDEFEKKRRIEILAPGESKSYRMEIRIG